MFFIQRINATNDELRHIILDDIDNYVNKNDANCITDENNFDTNIIIDTDDNTNQSITTTLQYSYYETPPTSVPPKCTGNSPLDLSSGSRLESPELLESIEASSRPQSPTVSLQLQTYSETSKTPTLNSPYIQSEFGDAPTEIPSSYRPLTALPSSSLQSYYQQQHHQYERRPYPSQSCPPIEPKNVKLISPHQHLANYYNSPVALINHSTPASTYLYGSYDKIANYHFNRIGNKNQFIYPSILPNQLNLIGQQQQYPHYFEIPHPPSSLCNVDDEIPTDLRNSVIPTTLSTVNNQINKIDKCAIADVKQSNGNCPIIIN